MSRDTLYIRNERLHLLTVFFLPFLIYLWSAPQTVVLEDDGLFILAAYFNGIAHPPGYPLYTMFGHFMTYLPIGSVAYRIHILSSLFGALACASLWWVMMQLVPSRIYAYIASLALGFSQMFWSQAIIAEVYTLNVLLFLLLFLLAMRYPAESQSKSRYLIMLMGLLYGLSLSNHWPLLLLSTPAFIILIYPMWRRFLRESLYAFPCLLVGLLPYMWMVYRSQMGPEFSFYGALESWKDFWFVLSRKGYSGLDQSLSAGWWDKWQFCIYVLKESIWQFSILGASFSIVGFVFQWKKWPLRIGIALTIIYISNTFILIGLLGFDYELLHQNIFRVYPLIAYTAMAIWLGLGMFVVIEWLTNHYKGIISEELFKVGLSLLLIGMVLILGARMNYRAKDDWAKRYAYAVLNTIEAGAIIFTDGDLDMSPLGYFNMVEGLREDVTLYNSKGVGFSNRLFFPLKDSLMTRKENIADFIAKQDRSIYYTYGLPHDYQVINYGLYNKINTDPTTTLEKSVATYEIVDYFKGILAKGEPIDAWEKMHFRLLTTDYCILSLNLLRDNSNNDTENIELNNWIKIICNSYQGLLEEIDYYLNHKQPNVQYLQSLIRQAEIKKEQAVLKSEIAKLDFLKARFYDLIDQSEKAEFYYKEAVYKWPHPDNPAYGNLQLNSKRY